MEACAEMSRRSVSNHDGEGDGRQKFAYVTMNTSNFARFARAFVQFSTFGGRFLPINDLK